MLVDIVISIFNEEIKRSIKIINGAIIQIQQIPKYL